MFQFIGYSVLSGPDCLNTSPSMVDNIKSTQIQNGIFDHLNISKVAMMTESTTIPTEWNYDTIIDVDFNGNLNGGNVDFLVEQISSIKIKRREKGTFNWITLESIPINTAEDLTFTFIDRLNAYGKDYEYAFVPVLEDIEGNYIINSIFSEFNGVFIGDFDNIYKFLYDVDYGTNARNQQIGTFTPLGRKYPVIVANGLLSYETGSVTASILNDDFDKTGKIDSVAIIEKQKAIKDFLTNKKAKLLKDWQGNVWLCAIVNAPQMTYKSGSSMAIPVLSFDWAEIGDPDNQQDLYNSGLVKEVT